MYFDSSVPASFTGLVDPTQYERAVGVINDAVQKGPTGLVLLPVVLSLLAFPTLVSVLLAFNGLEWSNVLMALEIVGQIAVMALGIMLVILSWLNFVRRVRKAENQANEILAPYQLSMEVDFPRDGKKSNWGTIAKAELHVKRTAANLVHVPLYQNAAAPVTPGMYSPLPTTDAAPTGAYPETLEKWLSRKDSSNIQ